MLTAMNFWELSAMNILETVIAMNLNEKFQL